MSANKWTTKTNRLILVVGLLAAIISVCQAQSCFVNPCVNGVCVANQNGNGFTCQCKTLIYYGLCHFITIISCHFKILSEKFQKLPHKNNIGKKFG